MVDDLSISAAEVQVARAEWWATISAEPEIQPVSEPLPDEVLDDAWTHRPKNAHALRPRFPEPEQPCFGLHVAAVLAGVGPVIVGAVEERVRDLVREGLDPAHSASPP